MNKITKWALILAVLGGLSIYGQHIERQADVEAQQQGWPSAKIRDEALDAGYTEPDAWLTLKRGEYAQQSAMEQEAAKKAIEEKARAEEEKKAQELAAAKAIESIVAEPSDEPVVDQDSSSDFWMFMLFPLLLVAGAFMWAYERWEIKNNDALAARDRREYEKKRLELELERLEEEYDAEIDAKTAIVRRTEAEAAKFEAEARAADAPPQQSSESSSGSFWKGAAVGAAATYVATKDSGPSETHKAICSECDNVTRVSWAGTPGAKVLNSRCKEKIWHSVMKRTTACGGTLYYQD